MPILIVILLLILALLLGWLWFLHISEKVQDQAVHYESSEKLSVSSVKKEVEKDVVSQIRNKKELVSSRCKTIWEQGGFKERLQVADVDMPLLFETPISDELKQVVLADLNLIFGHLTGHSYYTPRNPRLFMLEDQETLISKGIQLDGRGATWPNLLHGELMILNQDGVDNVVIFSNVIDSYEKAWEARKSDPEKYEDLEVFIEWLNTSALADLQADNPFWLFGYDGISNAHAEEAAEFKKMLLPKGREDLRVRHPSILGFTYVDQELLEKEGAVGQLPHGVTLADGKYIDKEGVPYQQALFLYDGTKWYIAFAPAGT